MLGYGFVRPFADRLDLLEKLANGNGQWCATVAGECDRGTPPGVRDRATFDKWLPA
jgi:hypothetical protein